MSSEEIKRYMRIVEGDISSRSPKPSLLEEHVGKKARFKSWKPNIGTIRPNHIFEVAGVQQLYDGTMGYQVRPLGSDRNSSLLYPARPNELDFVHPDEDR